MTTRLSNADIPQGFTFAATHCGLKKSKLDLAILISETPASAAAIFTTNRVKAAPVIASQLHLRQSAHRMHGVIVNSGNANCCTGSEGLSAAATTALKLARELGRVHPSQILVCSTGVIGVPLRWQKIVNAIPRLARARHRTASSFAEFTRAIMRSEEHTSELQSP